MWMHSYNIRTFPQMYLSNRNIVAFKLPVIFSIYNPSFLRLTQMLH